MKKQIIAAAIAASMSAVALADVSITGAAQVNYTYKDYGTGGTDTNTISHDFDLKITGKSGNTTIVMDIENTDTTGNGTTGTAGSLTKVTTVLLHTPAPLTVNALADVTYTANTPTTAATNELNVKNAYMSTKIGDINVKMGTFTGGEALLANASPSENKVSLDTTIGGVKLQYENNPAASTGNSVTVSGSMNGVGLTYEKFETKDDVIVDLAYGPVKAQYRNIDHTGTAKSQTSYQVDADIQGMTLTYANIDAVGNAVSTDGFFGEYTGTTVTEADGFGVKTSMAGNTINLKSYEVTNSSKKEDHTKVIVTRNLESGATLEATYHDMDNGTTSEGFEALDIELRIAF